MALSFVQGVFSTLASQVLLYNNLLPVQKKKRYTEIIFILAHLDDEAPKELVNENNAFTWPLFMHRRGSRSTDLSNFPIIFCYDMDFQFEKHQQEKTKSMLLFVHAQDTPPICTS